MEKKNQWQEAYQGVCLFLVLLGMFLCMERLLEPEVSLGALGMSAALLVAAAGVMGLGSLEKAAACLLFLAVQCFVAAGYHGYLLVGAKAIGNQVLELCNYHNRTGYLLWYLEAEEPGKSLFFLVLCGFVGFVQVLVYRSGWGQKSRLASLALCPGLVVAASLSLGKAPSAPGSLLLLAGLVAGHAQIGEKGSQPLAAAMYLSLAAGILFAVSPLAGRFLGKCHEPWLRRQLHFEDAVLDALEEYGNIRLFANAGVQAEYRLGNGEPDVTGREALQITVKKVPKENIYLKGFVGGDYENGRWKNVSSQEFSDWAQQQGYTSEEYQEIVRNFPYQFMKRGMGDAGQYNLETELKLRRSTRGYTLVPYFSEIPAGQQQEADGALAPQKQREFQWDTHLTVGDGQRVIYHNMYYFSEDDERVKAMHAYKEYAYRAYTRLPGEGLGQLRDFAEKEDKGIPGISYSYIGFGGGKTDFLADSLGNSRTEQRIRLVQELLWRDTEYSLELGEVPKGEDFAEYFLFGQKKGYCTHYATAGTLLLRMYDIPARFAAGYLVLPSDFKRNGDGTYTAVLTDERAHAWTEVYQENIGFCPIEMTPPSYVGMLQDLEPGQDVRQALAQKDAGREIEREEKEKGQEPGQDLEPGQDVQADGQEGGKEEEGDGQLPALAASGSGIWGKAAGILKGIALSAAAFALLASVFCSVRRGRIRRRQEAFSQPDRTAAVQALAGRMAWMLGILGFQRQRGMGDQEYSAVLQEAMPDIGWVHAVALLQKAAFSGQGATEEEYGEVQEIYGWLERKLRQEKGRVRAFFYDCRK